MLIFLSECVYGYPFHADFYEHWKTKVKASLSNQLNPETNSVYVVQH